MPKKRRSALSVFSAAIALVDDTHDRGRLGISLLPLYSRKPF